MRAVRILGLQRNLFAALEVSDIVDVQRAGVGGENERLRREGVNECGRIDAAIRAAWSARDFANC